jgi:hypothetical protein
MIARGKLQGENLHKKHFSIYLLWILYLYQRLMEQPQNTISSTTTLAALAGILFFGPFIARTKDSSSRQNGERISRDDFFIL